MLLSKAIEECLHEESEIHDWKEELGKISHLTFYSPDFLIHSETFLSRHFFACVFEIFAEVNGIGWWSPKAHHSFHKNFSV